MDRKPIAYKNHIPSFHFEEISSNNLINFIEQHEKN